MKKRFLILFYTLLYICNVRGTLPTDSMVVGLMTCAPGTEAYSLYGHTALRITNYTDGSDWVFNYGVFSFDQPHFVWRFTRGQCDYQIGAVPYSYFAAEYQDRGSSVFQQTLNLTSKERWALWCLLVENMQPSHREYRYNFLYDNCTTRARDRVEQAIDGEVVYPSQKETCSYRDIIHHYTAAARWSEVGNDLCLGAAADVPVTARQEMFAPFRLMRYAEGAMIRDKEGKLRPLVLQTEKVVEGERTDDSVVPAFHFPLMLAWGMALLVFVLTFVEVSRRKTWVVLDVVWMTLVGCMGCVITFLFFASEHPTVDTNWQIWVLNPLPLICMPWVVRCAVKGVKTYYHVVNAVVLTIFIILSPLIPQDFSAVVVPLALVLWIRSIGYIIRYKKLFIHVG